jgi:hypothetical protein
MKPSRHIIISFSLSLALWLFLKSLSAAVVCFIAGVFIDVDHLLEYLINFGWKGFSLQNCYRECGHSTARNGSFRFKKLYLIFHSIEFAAIFWLLAFLTKNIYIFAFALGYFAHLFADIVGNREFVQPCFYFISWRASHKFRTVKMMTKEISQKNRHLDTA